MYACESGQFFAFFVLGHADCAGFLVCWEVVETFLLFEFGFGQGTDDVGFEGLLAFLHVHLFEAVEEVLW